MNSYSVRASVAIVMCIASCSPREARLRSFDKDHWIQVALGSPLPSGMSELSGIGQTWQGFGCYFRFRINQEDLKKFLVENGYKENDAKDFESNFTLPSRFEKYFSPAWKPDLGLDSKVYTQHPPGYMTLVIVNHKSDVVHVWTGGGNSPGPFPSNK